MAKQTKSDSRSATFYGAGSTPKSSAFEPAWSTNDQRPTSTTPRRGRDRVVGAHYFASMAGRGRPSKYKAPDGSKPKPPAGAYESTAVVIIGAEHL